MQKIEGNRGAGQWVAGFFFVFLTVLLAWIAGRQIIAADFESAVVVVLLFGAAWATVIILRDWRSGFYLFLTWLMIEDLVRKYMGNGLTLFFGKDILLVIVYLSFFLAIRRGQENTFRPPFFLFLS